MATSDDGSAAQSAEEQCIALTSSGERCGRRANDGRFCYQHDEDDPTIDEEETDADDGSNEESSGSEEESSEDDTAEDDSVADDSATDDSTDDSNGSNVMEVRSAVVEVSSDLIGRPLDGVVEVGKTEDGWRAVVEVVERRAVPDTQDILGRYELTLDDAETVTGYRRIGRSRRADTDARE